MAHATRHRSRASCRSSRPERHPYLTWETGPVDDGAMLARVAPLALLLLLATLGCESSASRYYEAFRAANPQWGPDMFPGSRSHVGEVVAALWAPSERGTSRTTELEVLEWTPEGWSRSHTEDVLAGQFEADAGSDYLVTAVVACQVKRGVILVDEARRVWYLLPRNQLASYDHCFCGGSGPLELGMSCEFKRRPASEAALEREAQELLGRKRGQGDLYGTTCPSLEHYQRGLVLLDAGRHAEARAMLERGDGFVISWRDGRIEAPKTIAWCREPAQRTRELLIRRLEVAEVD